jgi:hypothetical protein
MPLVRVPGPFDHPDWLFELKHDGFRALAHVEGHRCTLVSRRQHVYKQYPMLLDASNPFSPTTGAVGSRVYETTTRLPGMKAPAAGPMADVTVAL